MLFDKITPEAAGISSAHVAEYIDYLERRGLTTHSVLMMRGDNLFAEYYWAPFTADFCHRMYSCTKSYVSIAIGLLLDEGKLSLDDTIVSHFPEKIDREIPPYLAEQTIRDMLMMQTCGTYPYWFTDPEPDRTRMYLNKITADHPAGTIWTYDSTGSQVLSSLVEKLSGMRLLDYLKMKIFDKIGTFRTAEVLQTKNGDSWGDSALVCRPRDMLSCGRFLMNGGRWNGEQLLSEAYVKEATAHLCDNDETGFGGRIHCGYGYQIWSTEDDGFGFIGMGDQLLICLPKKDLLFVITSDNQGNTFSRELILAGFFDMIARRMQDAPLAPDAAAEKRLAEVTADLKLRAASGRKSSPYAAELSGREYICAKNATGITKFRFDFTDNGGTLTYTNAQGEKSFAFGMCENAFGKFPELGYSNDRGGLRTTDGFMYNTAFSAAWIEEKELVIRVQIIDRYFGNATFRFSFKGDEAFVKMVKTAEDFLAEYQGAFVAKRL